MQGLFFNFFDTYFVHGVCPFLFTPLHIQDKGIKIFIGVKVRRCKKLWRRSRNILGPFFFDLIIRSLYRLFRNRSIIYPIHSATFRKLSLTCPIFLLLKILRISPRKSIWTNCIRKKNNTI